MFLHMHMPSIFPAAESYIICPDKASPGSTVMCAYKVDELKTAHVFVFVEHLDTGGNCSLYLNPTKAVRDCDHIGVTITSNISHVTVVFSVEANGTYTLSLRPPRLDEVLPCSQPATIAILEIGWLTTIECVNLYM